VGRFWRHWAHSVLPPIPSHRQQHLQGVSLGALTASLYRILPAGGEGADAGNA